MKLSILIPTVYGREQQFNTLIEQLTPQITHEVEILHLKDNKEMTIGEKRNKLYAMANGEYSIQVDDDDSLHPEYVSKVLEALQSNPDCVCYFEHIDYMGTSKVSCHSNDFDDWGENYREEMPEGKVNFYHHVRTPFFKDVIKTDICRAIPVKDMRYAEDITWSRDLKKSGLIQHEEFINDFMYYYTYSGHLTEQQLKERYGIK